MSANRKCLTICDKSKWDDSFKFLAGMPAMIFALFTLSSRGPRLTRGKRVKFGLKTEFVGQKYLFW